MAVRMRKVLQTAGLFQRVPFFLLFSLVEKKSRFFLRGGGDSTQARSLFRPGFFVFPGPGGWILLAYMTHKGWLHMSFVPQDKED